jgi:hypothetical protein
MANQDNNAERADLLKEAHGLMRKDGYTKADHPDHNKIGKRVKEIYQILNPKEED